MKQSPTQRPPLHTSPVAQKLPSDTLDQVIVDVAAVQTWQGFAGFTVPSG